MKKQPIIDLWIKPELKNNLFKVVNKKNIVFTQGSAKKCESFILSQYQNSKKNNIN